MDGSPSVTSVIRSQNGPDQFALLAAETSWSPSSVADPLTINTGVEGHGGREWSTHCPDVLHDLKAEGPVPLLGQPELERRRLAWCHCSGSGFGYLPGSTRLVPAFAHSH